MSDPFDEPAYEPEREPSRFEQFRASLTSPGKVANEPLEEPPVEHKRTWSGEPVDGGSGLPKDDGTSLFQRFRKSISGEDKDDQAMHSPDRVAPGGEFDRSTSTEHVCTDEDTDDEKPEPEGNTESGGTAAEPLGEAPKEAGWTFFKTKEQKELVALEEDEEKERRKAKDEQKAERKALEKEYKPLDDQIKDAVKKNLKVLAHEESEEKKKREEVAKEQRKEHEETEKTFKKELKKIK